MKKAWKIAGTFTAWVLAGCITVTSVAIFSKRETVEAKASFNGTADIVAKNSEENPFRILELVPSKTMGEFGYMYDEKACINWEENLKNIKTADERRIYMNETLYNQWKSLFNEQDSDDKDQALSCAKDRYEEQYALETGDNPENWKMIEFPGTDLEILLGGEIDDTENGSGDSVNENTYPGYEMVSDPSGDYCLMSHYAVAPKVDGKYTGNFNQLVEHYVYSGTNNQYYGVKFTAATLTQVDGQWTSGGQTLYSATRKDNLGNEDTFNSVLENTPNAYVYRLGYNDIYGHMECIGKISDDEVTYQNISQDTKNYYYTVEFTYVDLVANPLIGNETYYVADAVEFLVDEQGKGQGEYGANVGAIYTPVAEGEEGYFNQTAKDCFEYVGEGAGTHRMVKNPQAELTVPVKIGKIYYKGGYWSNQFLQKHVFHQDNGSMNFTTTVVEPKEMNFICSSGEIGRYDLLYISESCLIGSEAKDQNGGAATFSVQNDIEWETALSIMMRARQSGNRLSVIVDKTINQNVDYNNVTNVERLVAMITSDQFFEINKGSNLSGADDEDYKIKLSKNTTIVEVPWFELTYQGGNKSYLDEYEFGYVNNNIYVFPGNTGASQNSGVPFLYDQFHTKEIAGGKDDNTFLENAKAKGFGEIADYINTQNLKREMENNAQGVHYDLFDRSITKATVVEYIISYNDEEETVWDSGINILEIQPGKTAGNEATLKADEFKALFTELSYDIGDVEVTYMTTAEFVGRIEDLSKYDLIYFGLDTTAFNVENGVTKYNDYQMDGLIYSNIGDVYTFWVNDNEAFSGMLESDYDDSGNLIKWNKDSFPKPRTNKYRNENNTYRLAGNDITKENKEKLLNFIKAGNPIMVDPKFYNDDSTAVNETYIDNCSVMYEFMQEALKYENVVAYDKKDKSTDVPTLMKYFQIGKPNLKILDHTMEPNRTLSQKESLFYAVEEKDNTRYVTLEFQVTNQGAANAQTAFETYFYIDANSDGKFSATQEAVYPLDMTLTQNDSKLLPSVRTVKAEESTKKEEVNAGESSSTEEANTEEANTEESNIEEEVTTEYYYEITPGVQNTYCITYELPEDTYGLIPWKLVVSQKGNKLRSVYKQGYYYSPYADKKEDASETEKEEGIGEENSEEKKPITIRVLQINTDSTSSFKTTWNMEESLANENSKFAQYMAMVQDFDIKVKTVTSNQYAIDYKAKLAEGKDYFASAVDDEKVDMLVMGFADCYTIKDVTALNGIVEYINSGKPVLFTHDTTSFNNNKNKPGAWGYLYNTMVRNLVGMDRYGVLDNSYVKAGKQLVKDKNANFSELKKKSEKLNVDIAYIPKSGKKIIAKHGQGFSYPVGFYYVNQGGSAKVTYWPFNRTVMNGYERHTTNVVQVNEGQITNYPFKIPETFKVANTHAQYYQLDLNEDADLDGESDIAVWYTLTGTSTYDCSPKDVRNNYYIYTKGNVTYSGVGHSSLEGDNIENDNEIKLYINTMIAAYSVGEKPPKIDLRKEAPMDAEKLKLMYVSFDDTVINNGSDFVVKESEKSIEKLEEEKEKGRETNCVYFTVTDRNIIKNLDKKVVEVRFGVPTHMTEDDYNGIVDPNEKQQYFLFEEEDGTKVCLKEFFPKVTTVDGKKVLAKGTGITYKAKIPADVLGDRKNVTVYAVARTKITQKFPTFNEKGEKVEKTVQKETDPCKATFRIQRMGLMDLD